MTELIDDEAHALRYCLEYQRASVRSIVEGLDESEWHRSVLPSGWTPAGMVEHLGDAERHWFQRVVTGDEVELAYDEGRPAYDPGAAFVTDRPGAAVLAYYLEQCGRSDAVLDVTPMSATPLGRHEGDQMDDLPSVRFVVLHMIEETAAHSGHLEIARELIDGQIDLGLR